MRVQVCSYLKRKHVQDNDSTAALTFLQQCARQIFKLSDMIHEIMSSAIFSQLSRQADLLEIARDPILADAK